MEKTGGLAEPFRQFAIAKEKIRDLFPQSRLFGFVESYLCSGFALQSDILQSPLNCLISDRGFGRKNEIDKRRYQPKEANRYQQFHLYLLDMYLNNLAENQDSYNF